MLTIFIRAILLYMLSIVAIRMAGKRQLGQFQPYELAMALIIADLLAAPISDVSTPLLHGALPIAALVIVNCLIAIICMRSDKARALISGKPSVVVSKGVVDDKELTRLCLSLSDLLEGMRESGILDPADMESAIMEANGKITAFQSSEKRPPSAKEMGVDAGYEGVPAVLIMDGRVQKHNLTSARLNADWLNNVLDEKRLKPKDVYLASLSTQGILSVQTREGVRFQKRALNAGKVEW